MKKFLLIALAVALGATSALAGDFAASGSYMLQGYSGAVKYDGGGKDADAWWINQFFLNTTVTQGIVSATISWEIVDSNWKELAGHNIVRNGNLSPYSVWDGSRYRNSDIVDQYWITAKLADGLNLKTGDYYLHWGNMIACYKQGGYNTGITYGLDMVDLGFTLAKIGEGWQLASNIKDADFDQYLLSASFKKAGPFTKLNLYYLYQMVEKGSYYQPYSVVNYDYGYDLFNLDKSNTSMFAGEFAVPIGPVALSGEFGMFSGKDWLDTAKKAEGDYVLLVAGLKDLVGFDLNGIVFYSTEKMYTGLGEGWSPLLILLNNDMALKNDGIGTFAPTNPANNNMTLFLVSGSYGVNDKITVGGTIMPYAHQTKKSVGTDGNIGMEVDLTGTYKFADNCSWMVGYGMVSGGEVLGKTDISGFTTKLNFTF